MLAPRADGGPAMSNRTAKAINPVRAALLLSAPVSQVSLNDSMFFSLAKASIKQQYFCRYPSSDSGVAYHIFLPAGLACEFARAWLWLNGEPVDPGIATPVARSWLDLAYCLP